jgi:anaerobic ribonucleoside-triphosphate reductase
MAGDIARAYDHACVDCHVQYIEMKEAAGLANITLDILDRTKPPHYGINTRWICKSCNQRKGTMTPERWADFCNDARLRQEHLASVAANPEEHGYLPFAVGS